MSIFMFVHRYKVKKYKRFQLPPPPPQLSSQPPPILRQKFSIPGTVVFLVIFII